MINFLCHTTNGDCEYFIWEWGYAKCTAGPKIVQKKPDLAGLFHAVHPRIPEMKFCSLASKPEKLPVGLKNPNLGDLFLWRPLSPKYKHE